MTLDDYAQRWGTYENGTPSAENMLTFDKLRTYETFGGDIDGWARVTKDPSHTPMIDDD